MKREFLERLTRREKEKGKMKYWIFLFSLGTPTPKFYMSSLEMRKVNPNFEKMVTFLNFG